MRLKKRLSECMDVERRTNKCFKGKQRIRSDNSENRKSDTHTHIQVSTSTIYRFIHFTFQVTAGKGTAGGSCPGATAETPAASKVKVARRAAASARLKKDSCGWG